MTSMDVWHAEKLGSAAVEALRHNGFDAHYCTTRSEALKLLLPWLTAGATVGLGGSMTLNELDLRQLARDAGCELLDHSDPMLDAAAKRQILRRQLTSDVFISSSNAITLDGQLVNIDGNGNRVAALSFGPAKTIVVAGVNKIVADVDEAFARLELRAAPMNNHRLDRPNPCVKTGRCMDCDGDSRICRIYHVLRKRPSASDFSVFIIGETLGF
ncbi:MAG: lactate utilization protein [Spirochaetes bacterium]|nr:lactate utilization protein [Spirochaetota bacterium]MBU0956084.1 lactate utilization protein [Spirochaetota bacterium]